VSPSLFFITFLSINGIRMSWSSVIGQHRVKELLRRALHEEKIAHAYLFWGMEGIGKDALALALAKTLNCERRTLPSTEPCNQCRSCMQADKLEHPNIKLVFSLPAAKSAETRDDSPLFKLTDAQIEEIQEQLRIKADNPYHNLTIANARQIRIASIRDVKRSISMSQSQSGHRVVIVSEADEMTVEAAMLS
jgi:DNA polymerase-3 subunit delta'